MRYRENTIFDQTLELGVTRSVPVMNNLWLYTRSEKSTRRAFSGVSQECDGSKLSLRH